MPTISKFLFDTRFDADPEPESAPPPPRLRFAEEDLEAARDDGHRIGLAAGRAQALGEIEARTATAIEAVARGMGQALADAAARHRDSLRDTLAAAIEIQRRLFPALAERHEAAEIETLLGTCLAGLTEEPRILIRAPESLVDMLQPRLDRAGQRAGFAGRIIVLGDGGLAPGQSRIEWADGGVARDTARIWSDIDAALARYLAPELPPAPDDTQAATEDPL
jgi:flagellar assembly protein FliH